jgi:hypothetical protein
MRFLHEPRHATAAQQALAERAQFDINFALRTGDPFTMYGVLETLDLRTRETAELIFSFGILRSRGFPADDLSSWATRATNYLGRVVERSAP